MNACKPSAKTRNATKTAASRGIVRRMNDNEKHTQRDRRVRRRILASVRRRTASIILRMPSNLLNDAGRNVKACLLRALRRNVLKQTIRDKSGWIRSFLNGGQATIEACIIGTRSIALSVGYLPQTIATMPRIERAKTSRVERQIERTGKADDIGRHDGQQRNTPTYGNALPSLPLWVDALQGVWSITDGNGDVPHAKYVAIRHADRPLWSWIDGKCTASHADIQDRYDAYMHARHEASLRYKVYQCYLGYWY